MAIFFHAKGWDGCRNELLFNSHVHRIISIEMGATTTYFYVLFRSEIYILLEMNGGEYILDRTRMCINTQFYNFATNPTSNRREN